MKNAAVMMMLLATAASAQVEGELASYIAARRKVMDDPARPIADREAVAMELAAALDRAARGAPEPASRRASWSEARGLLDGFSARNRDHPRAALFRFQGAVYLWAEGQSWAKQAERDPGDAASRARAASAFEGAAERLRGLAHAPKTDDALSQNVRFRLAQTLFDRSAIDPERPATPALRAEALAILDAKPFREPSLRGFAELLRAKLLAALGRFDEAHRALEEATRADPPPPMADRLAAMMPIAAGRKRFGEARAALEAAPIDEEAKDALRVRLLLAERAALEPGPGHEEAEADAFRRVAAMRAARPAEARAVLMALARSVDEPGPKRGPEAWSLLAEGAALLGQPDRAAKLDVAAAARSEGRGDPATARASRFRAAAVLFEAGRFARADALLSRLADDPDAGPLRPRAGLLRALARGRGLAAGEAGITRAGYLAALADQVENFPDDPTTGEARWLLGRERLASGDRAGAEGLWASVPRSHARWLDARLAEAALRRGDLEDRRLVDEPSALAPARDEARGALDRVAADARDDAERADAALERIRLELVPGVGDPTLALEAVEKLRQLPLREDQRGRADRLRIVALAITERFLEAERAASDLAPALSPESLVALAGDLDRAASGAETERVASRIGGVARIVADCLAEAKGVAPSIEAEAKLRRARSRMLAGDSAGAREVLEPWTSAADSFAANPAALADLADAMAEAGLHARAIACYRLLARRVPSGSPRWFAARLGQARTLGAAKKTGPARQIVEGTALLHPNFGGPAMKSRFAALKRKLDES